MLDPHSEEEQLTFFSVYNQAAALVIQTFDMQRLQFHDYHGVLSLMYLPAGMRPEVLYVAHNAGTCSSEGRGRLLPRTSPILQITTAHGCSPATDAPATCMPCSICT